MKQRISVDRVRTVSLAVAAHVWRDGVEAGSGERCNLMAPRIPGLREPVAKKYERAGPSLGEVDSYTVGFDQAVGDLGH